MYIINIFLIYSIIYYYLIIYYILLFIIYYLLFLFSFNYRVTRDNKTKKLNVLSMVYKINDLDSSISPLFPMEHPQNFMYLAIDPLNRYVTIWYHASDSYYQ